jgi:signal transduction histidine kinase
VWIAVQCKMEMVVNVWSMLQQKSKGHGNLNSLTQPIIRLWQWWFTPRSTDPTVIYRERALRVFLPLLVILRGLVMLVTQYPSTSGNPNPFAPMWISLLLYIVFFTLAFIFLAKNKIGLASICFLAHWYLTDMLNLPNQGFWYPGFEISLIIEVILGTLLLPSRAILPFMIFQLTTAGIWGRWLDGNYYHSPLLSTGQPVADFQSTFLTLVAQEIIIVLIIRYLRIQMEKSIRLQQATITELEKEIDERHHLQAVREKYIDELNKKNEELERFTYTVSHDLRSPLVTIKGFVGMIAADIQNKRSERISSDIQRIASATDKMDALLTDLLALSRVGRIVSPPEEIDPVQLIQDAIDNVDAQIRSKNITVHISSALPKLYGDRVRLREVFENLIGNAAKYIGDQPTPVIEIGARAQAHEQVFYVKDNGIGIDPKYHTRIFNLFEKLNPAIEGTGIGLAIVKRIIEVHGGRVWVESEGPGKGSAFCFTIPDRK